MNTGATAVEVAELLADKVLPGVLPNGIERPGELVKAGLSAMAALPAMGALAKGTGRALAAPLERLVRPRRLDLTIGGTVCIRQAARFDLIELLMLAQGQLGQEDLRLVPPGVTFAEACHRYCWPGLLIEFYPAARGSGLHPHYLALDCEPDPSRPARSTLNFTVVDTATRPC